MSKKYAIGKETKLENLKIAVKQYVNEVCEILNETAIPLENWSRIIEKELLIETLARFKSGYDTSLGPLWLPRVDEGPDLVRLYFFFVYGSRPIASFESILNLFEQDESLRSQLCNGTQSIEDWKKSESSFKADIWEALLSLYIDACWNSTGRIHFQDEIFESVWENHISYLKPTAVLVETRLFPLTSLNIFDDNIELETDLMIRPLNKKEIETWLNPNIAYFGTSLRYNEISNLQCAIEATSYRTGEENSSKIMAKENKNASNGEDRIQRALNTIRLATNQHVFIPSEQRCSRGLLHQNMTVRIHDARASIGQYKWHGLEGIEIDYIKKLWDQIKTHRNMSQYTLAFNRWSDAGSKMIQDQLIDYWIGLESLFTQDFNQELKFRGPLRIAAFLGQEGAEMVKIYRELQHSYDWRSAVVHGSVDDPSTSKLNKDGTLADVVTYTRNYLRESILRLLGSDITLRPIKIESNQFSGKRTITETEIDLLMRLGKEGLS